MTRRRTTISLLLAAAAAVASMVSSAPSAFAVALGNTGSGRPALAQSGGRLYVGWTGSAGTVGAREMLLGWSTSGGLRITKVMSERTPAAAGPALSGDGVGVYVAWPAGDAGNTLTAAYYTGSAVTCRTSFSGITTSQAVAMAADPHGKRYLAWVDPASRLNVAILNSSACATTHVMTLSSRVVLADTAVGGPGLAWDQTNAEQGMILAWAGTDAAHRLTTATVNGTSVLTNRSVVDFPVGSLTGATLATNDTDTYIFFQGTDGRFYGGYSQGRQPATFYVQDTGIATAAGIGANTPDIGYDAYIDATGHLNISRFCC